MIRSLNLAAAAVLFLHRLVHLLGTTVYLRLADLAEFPYKTTLLGGRWDLGPAGIGMFGVLWNVKGAVYMLALSAAMVSALVAGPADDWTQLLLWGPIGMGYLGATLVLLAHPTPAETSSS